MKRTFLDLRKTSNVTAFPAGGEMRLLVNASGNPVMRDENGVDLAVSMYGHTHTGYSLATHNHDGVYLPVGYVQKPELTSLGTAVTALSVDMDGTEYQSVSFSGDTSITAINAEALKPKEINLYFTASVTSVLTFPANWYWAVKPAGDQLTINAGERIFVRLRTIGTSPIHAEYQLLDT